MRPQVRLAGTDGLKQQARLTACRENYAIPCSGYRCIRIKFRDTPASPPSAPARCYYTLARSGYAGSETGLANNS